MKIRSVIRTVRWTFMLTGFLFMVILALAFTAVPWKWYSWLSNPGENDSETPDYIVMMGGGGVPSSSGLIRSWKTAEAADMFPGARVIVAMPLDDSPSAKNNIERELQMRGVLPERILRESKGRSTREQAVEIFKMLELHDAEVDVCIALVTSPEHIRRTWLSFKKAGFDRLVAVPGWSQAIQADLIYGGDDSGLAPVPKAVGGNMTVRYRLWDNLGIMIRCTREMVALAYYRISGWI